MQPDPHRTACIKTGMLPQEASELDGQPTGCSQKNLALQGTNFTIDDELAAPVAELVAQVGFAHTRDSLISFSPSQQWLLTFLESLFPGESFFVVKGCSRLVDSEYVNAQRKKQGTSFLAIPSTRHDRWEYAGLEGAVEVAIRKYLNSLLALMRRFGRTLKKGEARAVINTLAQQSNYGFLPLKKFFEFLRLPENESLKKRWLRFKAGKFWRKAKPQASRVNREIHDCLKQDIARSKEPGRRKRVWQGESIWPR